MTFFDFILKGGVFNDCFSNTAQRIHSYMVAPMIVLAALLIIGLLTLARRGYQVYQRRKVFQQILANQSKVLTAQKIIEKTTDSTLAIKRIKVGLKIPTEIAILVYRSLEDI